MANESDKTDYRLISGTFIPDEATQLLMTLIEDKISFHRKNIWSRRERFGETDAVGMRRIEELGHTKAKLIALIDEAKAKGKRLTIDCKINITLSP